LEIWAHKLINNFVEFVLAAIFLVKKIEHRSKYHSKCAKTLFEDSSQMKTIEGVRFLQITTWVVPLAVCGPVRLRSFLPPQVLLKPSGSSVAPTRAVTAESGAMLIRFCTRCKQDFTPLDPEIESEGLAGSGFVAYFQES
jgi:hypothetical protein